MKIRFAVTPPALVLHEDLFPDYLHACEALGFDTVWLSDVPLGPLGDPLFSLAFAAGQTRHLKLGANVVPLGRNPLWLAKQLAQLDRLSRGRLLVSFVPGLGAPQERSALGHPTGDRGKAVDEMMGLLRRWWAGDTVSARYGEYLFDEIAVQPLPQQQPLEIWLGGIGPAALERVARLADGWLTASATPAEAGKGRLTIEARAAELGRAIDPGHFGISIPYAQAQPQAAAIAALEARRADRDLSQILPLGRDALKSLIHSHLDVGISKFVLRSLTDSLGWREDLAWLAEIVLPLQT
ncbi:MAG: LLM class flavin-dependent oxidoreductase [Gammaproteobacteria bacterium]|nr:LLM class flavin-dependent oxidoreductase [Gammaproteobacteria bacterium]